jgi:hypothetical protein
MLPPQPGQVKLCRVFAVARCTCSASRFLLSLSMSLLPNRFQVVLESQESVGHILDVGFFYNRIGYLVPSSGAPAPRSLPEAMVDLFVDDGVEQFSPTSQRMTANAGIARHTRFFERCLPVS